MLTYTMQAEFQSMLFWLGLLFFVHLLLPQEDMPIWTPKYP